MFCIPFTASYETGALTYGLTLPWIRVPGPGNIVSGGFGGSGAEGGDGGIGAFGCAGDSRKGASKPADSGSCAGVTNSSSGGAGTTATKTTESGLGDIVASATYYVIDQEDTSGWIVDLNGRVKFGTASASRGLGSGKTDYAVQANVDKYFGAPCVSVGLGYKWLGEPTGVSYDNVVYGYLGGGYKFSRDTSFGVSYDWATAAVAVDGTVSPDVGGGLTLSYYF